MTFTKSLLLGSAAALVVVAGASAADLPSKKSAPSKYVTQCDAAGAGYFYIPGSDTCLKISGYAELDVTLTNVGNTYSNNPSLPATTNTTLGVTRNNHTFAIDNEIVLEAKTKTSYGDLYAKVAYEGDVAGGGVEVDRAYVQWAGITAGKYTTFMNFGLGGLYNGFSTNDYGTRLLAYTASFGGGASFTVSLEDSTVTRGNVGNGVYNGTRVPDVVGQLALSQGWGSVGIAAGFHQSPYAVGAVNKHVNGYGITSGATIKFGPNDTLALFAGWERNALKFIGGGMNTANGWQNTLVDFNDMGNQTGWSIVGQYAHNWTPSVSTTLEATYKSVRYSDDASATLATNNQNSWAVGQVTKWSPVAGLTFGLDTSYYHTTNKWNAKQVAAGPVISGSSSAFVAQFRVNRSF